MGSGGHNKKSIKDHLINGTYRSDRHGPVPPGMEGLLRSGWSEDRKKKQREANRRNYWKNPERARRYNKESYQKRRAPIISDPEYVKEKQKKHERSLCRRKAHQYFRDNSVSYEDRSVELVELKIEQLLLVRAVAMKQGREK